MSVNFTAVFLSNLPLLFPFAISTTNKFIILLIVYYYDGLNKKSLKIEVKTTKSKSVPGAISCTWTLIGG